MLGSTERDVTKEDSDIELGAAVLLRSNDGLILLTRRSKCLRIFPGIWVPPGKYAFLFYFYTQKEN